MEVRWRDDKDPKNEQTLLPVKRQIRPFKHRRCSLQLRSRGPGRRGAKFGHSRAAGVSDPGVATFCRRCDDTPNPPSLPDEPKLCSIHDRDELAMSQTQIQTDSIEAEDPKLENEKKAKSRRPASEISLRRGLQPDGSRLTDMAMFRYCVPPTAIESMAVSVLTRRG